MWEIFRTKEGIRAISIIVTSVGGILLAAFLGWAYWKTTTNHIDHTNTALLQQAVSNEKVAEAINKLSDIIDKKIK